MTAYTHTFCINTVCFNTIFIYKDFFYSISTFFTEFLVKFLSAFRRCITLNFHLDIRIIFHEVCNVFQI